MNDIILLTTYYSCCCVLKTVYVFMNQPPIYLY